MMKNQLRSVVRILLLLVILTGVSEPALIGSDFTSTARASSALSPLSQDLLPDKLYLPVVHSAYQDPNPGGGGSNGEWPTVAANPQRTSWTPEEVKGSLQVAWYRPIEAYISQNVQLIASNGLIYISTARGLYALNADNGNVTWRFDTELPLGNSPTVSGGILYVGGYDHKIHALDAKTGAHLWEYAGAKAGYDTNPLVVDGRVIAGNRDGAMYAIGAHGTPNQGRLLWKYQTNGPIHISAAYKGGVVFFASNDNYAYAIRADTGSLLWKSEKMPGDGFHSWWPVVYQDYVLFSASTGFRTYVAPGTLSVQDDAGEPYISIDYMDKDDIFPGDPEGTFVGPLSDPETWSHGKPVIDLYKVTQYLEDNPQNDPHWYKPERRTTVMLNVDNGEEYTQDTDADGYPEYVPIARAGGNSGNRYPPLVGPDGILYQSNMYQKFVLSQIRVMGWNFGTRYFSLMGSQGAIDEPSAISAGGNVIYRNLCCDRKGDWFSIDSRENGLIWDYDFPLSELAPGYDPTWTVLPDVQRMSGWYKGITDSVNGVYHNHGDQNPIVPYDGKLFVHRSNAIIAFAPQASVGSQPLLSIRSVQDNVQAPTLDDLKSRLESEVQKIINAGHLRPGYYNNGSFNVYSEIADYFDNPGDTLLALSRAYPYLSPQLQAQTKAYLQTEFQTYFDPVAYATIGWANGAAREAMPLPPEVAADAANFPARQSAGPRFSWSYPQHNFYALWKYAKLFPEQIEPSYAVAKSKIEVPVPQTPVEDYFDQRPYELNAYIAGYIGFLELQSLAGMDTVDVQLRSQVNNELNRLLDLRRTTFNKDTYYVDVAYHKRHLNISRNFIYLVPELGEYMHDTILAEASSAISEYEYIAQYWFVTRYNAVVDEGSMANLYDSTALFHAKAYILGETRDELSKYLDVPAFQVGDLFYINNLVTTIEAPVSVGLSSTQNLSNSGPACALETMH